jgi:predicted ATPase
MITQIEIENFKCFKNRVSFSLGKLTLLTGINGRGKSTLLQSLLLMKQSIEHDENTDKILLNGSCVSLNSFDDVRNKDTLRDKVIAFKYHFKSIFIPSVEKGYFEYHFAENPKDEMILQIPQIFLYAQSTIISGDTLWSSVERVFNRIDKSYYLYKDPDLTILSNLSYLIPHNFHTNLSYTNLSYLIPSEFDINVSDLVPSEFDHQVSLDSIMENLPDVLEPILKAALNFHRIHYISADRIGPKDFYLKSTLDKFPNVGTRGEFTTNLLYKEQDKLVDDRLCLGEDAKTLITQTEAWLSKIFGGAKLEIPSSKSSVLELLFNTSASKDRFKPANVGFGFHSVLPIIVSGLIAKEGEILIVENPEIHLHPRAQSELTKFLAKVSSCGVQVLVESHSDHILNGLRIAVLDKIIDSEDLSILYFQNDLENPVVQIPVQSDGGIEEWPDDFFDQTSKDFERLFGI